jgi:hypothetical protein
MKGRLALRFVALGYLTLLLGIPVALVFIHASTTGSPRHGRRSRHPRPSTRSG